MNIVVYLVVLFCFLQSGQALVPVCPQVKCSTICKEYVYEGGCQTCHCKVPACEPVVCKMFCEYGWDVDENGCEICQCRLPCDGKKPLQNADRENMYCGRGGVICPDDSYCDIHPSDRYAVCCAVCPQVKCSTICKEYVYEGGCQTCNCKVPACEPVVCRMLCEYGWDVDENGCEICQCRLPCDGKKPLQNADRENMYCGRGGVICPDDSYCDIHPSDRYAVCCANCSPVMCDLYCEHGFQTDENGCEICQCRPCPEGVELVACLKDPCDGATCSNLAAKTCKANYCGGCNAVWYDSNNQVVSCNTKG